MALRMCGRVQCRPAQAHRTQARWTGPRSRSPLSSTANRRPAMSGMPATLADRVAEAQYPCATTASDAARTNYVVADAASGELRRRRDATGAGSHRPSPPDRSAERIAGRGARRLGAVGQSPDRQPERGRGITPGPTASGEWAEHRGRGVRQLQPRAAHARHRLPHRATVPGVGRWSRCTSVRRPYLRLALACLPCRRAASRRSRREPPPACDVSPLPCTCAEPSSAGPV